MKSKFCERLKNLRKEKGLSQPQLAKEIGVSKGMISFWENGINEPTITYLIRLCNYFEVSADFLLGLSEY